MVSLVHMVDWDGAGARGEAADRTFVNDVGLADLALTARRVGRLGGGTGLGSVEGVVKMHRRHGRALEGGQGGPGRGKVLRRKIDHVHQRDVVHLAPHGEQLLSKST